ncbi:mitochondrial distribution and morphology proteins-domain-containing protein [Scheffersomyces xylosifermentans]|uniref:mitochondrial distribution and morphology proteins-domain-containing protein n=1 Tax=Scheffersomyces xylosifermentans TaxID=1304137 RepID=UPI00315D69A9
MKLGITTVGGARRLFPGARIVAKEVMNHSVHFQPRKLVARPIFKQHRQFSQHLLLCSSQQRVLSINTAFTEVRSFSSSSLRLNSSSVRGPEGRNSIQQIQEKEAASKSNQEESTNSIESNAIERSSTSNSNNHKSLAAAAPPPEAAQLPPPPAFTKLPPALPPVTKATLLSQASNSFSRLIVHLKWPLSRNNNNTTTLDVISAFMSWMVMGNLLWIILGTTTFGLMTMYSIHYFDHLWGSISSLQNSDDEEDEFKNKDNSILGYVTSSILAYGLGVKLQFQKGSILPELNDGKLRFKNFKIISGDGNDSEGKAGVFTRFSASVEAIEVTLSFNKWYEGNGLIYDLEIFGMNAKILKNQKSQVKVEQLPEKRMEETLTYSHNRHNDNIHFQYDLGDHEVEELSSIKNSKQTLPMLMDPNYQLEHVKIHDSYFEVYNNDSTETPLRISIFNADLPRLRGDRILIDFFNANNASGAINDSMFTIHKRQEINHYYPTPVEDNKIVRFKLDGIDMGALSRANPQSKLNWIVNGKAEIIADIKLPDMIDSEFQLSQEYKRVSNVVSELFNELASATKPREETGASENSDATLLKGAIAAIYHTFSKPSQDSDEHNKSEYVLVNVKVKFYDLKASLPKHLPMAASSSPFISLQDLRSLISFINNSDVSNEANASSSDGSNSHHATSSHKHPNPIIIKTTVIEKLSHLYNTDDLTQTAIFDSIISDIYEDLLKMIKMDEKRIIHEKNSLWSHSLASQLLLLGLGAMV